MWLRTAYSMAVIPSASSRLMVVGAQHRRSRTRTNAVLSTDFWCRSRYVRTYVSHNSWRAVRPDSSGAAHTAAAAGFRRTRSSTTSLDPACCRAMWRGYRPVHGSGRDAASGQRSRMRRMTSRGGCRRHAAQRARQRSSGWRRGGDDNDEDWEESSDGSDVLRSAISRDNSRRAEDHDSSEMCRSRAGGEGARDTVALFDFEASLGRLLLIFPRRRFMVCSLTL